MDDAVKRVREHPLRPFVSRTGTWTARRATELLLDRSLDLNSSESATLLRRWGRLPQRLVWVKRHRPVATEPSRHARYRRGGPRSRTAQTRHSAAGIWHI
jgi:hypothetical protein